MAQRTTILFTAVALLLLPLSAAAAPPPPIGMPGCDTSCGNMSVPYPFGMGPSYCYHSPGFNLTCDRSSNPPRLRLGDGTLQVAGDINTNLAVAYTGDIITNSGGRGRLGGGLGDNGPYTLAKGNQLILVGCNLRATVSSGNVTMSSCSSFCYDGDAPYDGETPYDGQTPYDDGAPYVPLSVVSSMFCSGTGCCQAPIIVNREVLAGSGQVVAITSYDLELVSFGWNRSDARQWPPRVFVAREGWFSQLSISDQMLSKNNRIAASMVVPLWLEWEIFDGPGQVMRSSGSDQCPSDAAQRVCKSNHTDCTRGQRGGYTCHCKYGYHGNPYIADGCRDINECEEPEGYGCFGQCTNTDGSFQCQCPRGTQGDPHKIGGCFSSVTGKCRTSCGNVSVPYPFGVGPPNCYFPGFNLTCEDTRQHPQRLMLGTFQVVDISIRNNTVRVINTDRVLDLDGSAIASNGTPFMGMGGGDEAPYSLSTNNELILIGCGVLARLSGTGRNGAILGGCSSSCSPNEKGTYDDPVAAAATSKNDDQYCYGAMGCCQARIAMSSDGMPSEYLIDWIDPSIAGDETSRPHSYAFVAEEGWFVKRRVAAQILQQRPTTPYDLPPRLEVPILLDWEILQMQPAAGSPPTANVSSPQKYLKCPGICRGKNSLCKPMIRGYSCHCSEGYDGNAYLKDGCKGGRKFFKGMSAVIGAATGFGIVLLVLGELFISNKLKYRRAQIMKRKFFEQNRGKLLQQLVSQRADISERMIIPLEELEKATNNFDKTRELGGGGHGTVYKGILSDLHVVAIKKPKKVVQEEIEEFINEVAILSQINHRNVVKLYGCCLETEVPMLVYEFISNGTLHDHLHVEEAKSLSWDNRQRIAIETAKSIAHLHSTTSTPIIHRDIKSVNILLDDTLTAKVADFGASRYVPIDKSGVTTRVQGTIGYMDPMYFYTGRLTEKSDVFGFGVMLVELLTRQKPFLYQSSGGDGLVAHFSTLFAEGNLLQILDPQVIEEGGKEVKEVASLAVKCIKLAAADRPTMRQVELVLESIQPSKHLVNVIARKSEKAGPTKDSSWIQDKGNSKDCSRQYSMEQEFEISARYPR